MFNTKRGFILNFTFDSLAAAYSDRGGFYGRFCLASLGLEGIGSSSFTFDSLAAAYSDRGGF